MVCLCEQHLDLIMLTSALTTLGFADASPKEVKETQRLAAKYLPLWIQI